MVCIQFLNYLQLFFNSAIHNIALPILYGFRKNLKYLFFQTFGILIYLKFFLINPLEPFPEFQETNASRYLKKEKRPPSPYTLKDFSHLADN